MRGILKCFKARTTLWDLGHHCRLNILTTKAYNVNVDSKPFHLRAIAQPVYPGKEAIKRNIALVPRQWLTTILVLGGVWNATEKGSGWLQEIRILGRREGFEARDVLLDGHFERCLGLRTVHRNTSDMNVRWNTWIYRERRKIAEVDV